MKKITATELAKNLSEVLNQTLYRGETFLVERNGHPVAEIRPPAPRLSTLAEVIAKIGHLRMPEGFADDLEEIRREQQPLPPPRWDD